MVTFDTIKNDKDVKNYIEAADAVMDSMGYTDHSYSHLNTVRQRVVHILQATGANARELELGSIAAHMHDIGICVNRTGHAAHGATMAFKLLTDMNMDSTEISTIIAAIGNHDEHTGHPVNNISAALIIADKTDIRRSRVRKGGRDNDIHDDVNYAVTDTRLSIIKEAKSIIFGITMDVSHASVYDLFSIYGSRLEMCRKAAEYLGFTFSVKINDLVVKG